MIYLTHFLSRPPMLTSSITNAFEDDCQDTLARATGNRRVVTYI